MRIKSADIIMQNKIFLWIAAVTGALLLIPLIAMQLTNQVDWNLVDFGAMGILLFGISSLFVLTVRMTNNKSRRIIIGAFFALAFLYLWAELAVGIFTGLGS